MLPLPTTQPSTCLASTTWETESPSPYNHQNHAHGGERAPFGVPGASKTMSTPLQRAWLFKVQTNGAWTTVVLGHGTTSWVSLDPLRPFSAACIIEGASLEQPSGVFLPQSHHILKDALYGAREGPLSRQASVSLTETFARRGVGLHLLKNSRNFSSDIV